MKKNARSYRKLLDYLHKNVKLVSKPRVKHPLGIIK